MMKWLRTLLGCDDDQVKALRKYVDILEGRVEVLSIEHKKLLLDNKDLHKLNRRDWVDAFERGELKAKDEFQKEIEKLREIHKDQLEFLEYRIREIKEFSKLKGD